MRVLANLLLALAILCFVAAAVSFLGFVVGGFDAIDGGASGAVIAYVPVTLAFGLVGTIAWAIRDTVRDSGREAAAPEAPDDKA